MNNPSLKQPEYFNKLKSSTQKLRRWVNLSGIITIVIALFLLLWKIGLFLFWIPIWLGLLLLQVGRHAKRTYINNDPEELNMLLQKFRLYFIVQGIFVLTLLTSIIILLLGFFLGLMSFSEIVSKSVH